MKVGVLNLMGNVFMKKCEDAFEAAEQFMKKHELKEHYYAQGIIKIRSMVHTKIPIFKSVANTYKIPIVMYFHENQITYPWSPNDRDIIKERDHHYGFINKDMRNQANRGILQNKQPTIPRIANAQRGSFPVPPKSGPSRGMIKVTVPGIPTNLH